MAPMLRLAGRSFISLTYPLVRPCCPRPFPDLEPLLRGILNKAWVNTVRACALMDALVGDGLDLMKRIEPHEGKDPMQRQRKASGIQLRPAELLLSRPAVLKHCLEHHGLPVDARLDTSSGSHLRTLLSESGRQLFNYYSLVPCSEYLESVHVLLAAGADPNGKDALGRPPLEDYLAVLGILSRDTDVTNKHRVEVTAGLAALVGALLPLTTHWPIYNGLPPDDLIKELRRPAADVLRDLVRVAKEPRQQLPGARLPIRERLLMISVGYRLTQLEQLLTLLPLTAVPDYVQWFTLIAQHILSHGGTSAGLHEHNGVVKRLIGDESPISAALLASFKVHMAAHPSHLGLYVLLRLSNVLKRAVYQDASCWPALLQLPQALLVAVHEGYGGALPHGLWDVARSACQLAEDLKTHPTGQRPPISALSDSGYAVGLLRICALPTAEVSDDQEELLHQAAGSMSLAACCGDDKKADFVDGKKLFHALPPFLDELAAPASKGVLTLWAKIVKGALKDIKAGRAIDPRRLQSVIRLLDLLSECRELEVLSPKYEQMAVHEAGLKEEYLMQVLQPRVQQAMAALRTTPLWHLLRDLYDATELPASLGGVMNVVGAHGINRLLLGGVVGAHEPGKELKISMEQSDPNTVQDMLAQIVQNLLANKPAPARQATVLDSDLAREARRNKLLYLEVCSHCGRAPGDLERGNSASAATKGKLSRCSRCHLAKYCGRECQLAHWKGGHKAKCKGLAVTGKQ